MTSGDTIAAIATGQGGAITVIRVSGPKAMEICGKIFTRDLCETEGNTLRYGHVADPQSGKIIDDAVVSIFRAPHSYTGEDSVEISCHASRYITGEIMRLLIRAGARNAEAGEFTMRAFLNGKLDLAQAEAVADIIASQSAASHAIAFTQMRGGYSSALKELRSELLQLTSLLELELDFSEEDVEFADRTTIRRTMQRIGDEITRLKSTFALGNAIKEGVITAIVGQPNVGKSTLLNRLAGEERAMVSDIAGTTRDSIEECVNIDGIMFRFIDTAGLHETDDRLEQMGIERTQAAISRARIILAMTDSDSSTPPLDLHDGQQLIVIRNKCDLLGACGTGGSEVSEVSEHSEASKVFGAPEVSEPSEVSVINISALTGEGMDRLKQALLKGLGADAAYRGEAIVSDSRHYEALEHSSAALEEAIRGLDQGLTSDLLSEDIRQVLYHLGTITGEITDDEILGNIFSRFCVGK